MINPASTTNYAMTLSAKDYLFKISMETYAGVINL